MKVQQKLPVAEPAAKEKVEIYSDQRVGIDYDEVQKGWDWAKYNDYKTFYSRFMSEENAREMARVELSFSGL